MCVVILQDFMSVYVHESLIYVSLLIKIVECLICIFGQGGELIPTVIGAWIGEKKRRLIIPAFIMLLVYFII